VDRSVGGFLSAVWNMGSFLQPVVYSSAYSYLKMMTVFCDVSTRTRYTIGMESVAFTLPRSAVGLR
jgi:hypothetical protein